MQEKELPVVGSGYAHPERSGCRRGTRRWGPCPRTTLTRRSNATAAPPAEYNVATF